MNPQSLPTAETIAIGTELTIGQVLDTNTAYAAAGLERLGFRVVCTRAVPDDWALMRHAMEEALGRSLVTIVTGGLGPTKDDFTKAVLHEIFGGELVEDARTLRAVEERLRRLGIEMLQSNHDQCLVPSTCEVLHNDFGTAPGMVFRRGEHLLVSLPGVPYEMEGLFRERVTPLLQSLTSGARFHRTVSLYGTPESTLAEELKDWESSLAPVFSLAYLPSPQGIRLRLTGNGVATPEMHQLADLRLAELEKLLGDRIFGHGEEDMPMALARMLRAGGRSLATAESCTAGRLGALLTAEPGASHFYRGGVVAYSDDAKLRLLGLDAQRLAREGAVSQWTAEAMARAVRERLGADYGLATTGLMGPEGDGTDTPVGTLWVAWAGARGVGSRRVTMGNLRRVNLERSAFLALNSLRLFMLGE
ncbi:MAG: damage-inducible protein CinA [Bacteroidia bacterium]|nr:MAG: damage-inducible protein CinA [Bacteroidia bacterium]